MMDWKLLVFKLKIFGWYLLTEPIRQLRDVYHSIISVAVALNKTLTWVYISIIFMIMALLVGKKFIAGTLLFFLLFFVLLWEWESGFFMHRYRQTVKKKLNKEAEKDGKPK